MNARLRQGIFVFNWGNRGLRRHFAQKFSLACPQILFYNCGFLCYNIYWFKMIRKSMQGILQS